MSVPLARRETGELVVVVLIEEIRAEGERPEGPLEAMTQPERRVRSLAGVEVVVDAQGGVQDALARGFQIQLLGRIPAVAMRIPEIGVSGRERELLGFPLVENREIE